MFDASADNAALNVNSGGRSISVTFPPRRPRLVLVGPRQGNIRFTSNPPKGNGGSRSDEGCGPKDQANEDLMPIQ